MQPMLDWTYAPAPESSAIAAIKDRYLPYIDGTFVEGGGEDLDTHQSRAPARSCRPSPRWTPADIDRAVKAARRAYEKVWSTMPGAERGKYLFRIARGIAERSRELAVVETLDNGKPIKETRDFDVPTAAQHFFYHAGWADKLQHLGLGPAPRPLGVAGQVIPWNFPLLMAAWKIAPALAAGNTVVIKPAETTSVSVLVLAEIIADADLPPGVVNIVTGAGDIGSTWSTTRASTRSPSPARPRWAGGSSGSWPGPGARSPSSSAARAPTSSSRTPPRTRRSKGSSTGSSSTRARSAAPARGCWSRSRSPTSSWRGCKDRVETLRVGDPLDKNTDVGAINSEGPAGADHT